MFTGLVAEIGTVEDLSRAEAGARIRVRSTLAPDLGAGDSVAVNGACLTVAGDPSDAAFEADVMNQTLELTTLGELRPGARVNLEPPVRAGDRLGGHLVQGHVDGTAGVTALVDDGFSADRRLRRAVPRPLSSCERGSVALDGVSLTVAAVSDGSFEVSLIPETLERTTLGEASPGRR